MNWKEENQGVIMTKIYMKEGKKYNLLVKTITKSLYYKVGQDFS